MAQIKLLGKTNIQGKTIFETAPQAPAFAPTDISGLQLWLDASDTSTLYNATAGGSLVTTNGSTVARWQDKSGNNRHFTQSTVNSRPVLNTANQNDKSVLYFDSDFMTGAVTGFRSLGSTTIIAVTKPLSAATQDVYTMAVWSHGQQGQNRYLAVQGSSANLTGETIVVNTQTSNARQLGSSTYTRVANTAQILTSTFSTGGTKLYANSSEVSLNLTYAGASTTANSSPSAVGWSDDIIRLNGYYTSAAIAGPKNRVCEFLIYNSVLTTQQRTDVWNYLSTKWAI